MPRRRVMSASALNIKLHPHTPELYRALFDDVYQKRDCVKIRGTDWGTIGWMRPLNHVDPMEGLVGELYRFVNINSRDPWFDNRSREILEIGENDPPPVPDYLKPNLRRVLFIFYPQKHRLFFDSSKLSPSSAGKIFQGLFGSDHIVTKYGPVDVIVETSHEAIEKILKIPTKTRLEIYISLPNPDETSHLETKIRNRLASQRAKTLTEKYTSDKHIGLEPDEETIALMQVARSNGRITAIGYDGEKKIIEDTIPHPLVESEKYDPDRQPAINVLDALSSRLWSEISRI